MNYSNKKTYYFNEFDELEDKVFNNNWDKDGYFVEKEKFTNLMQKEKKEKVIKDKPHINIGNIGHKAHGKTSVMNAILDYANKTNKKIAPISTPTIDVSSQEFETSKYRFTYFDIPGDNKYTKNMFIGASQMDAAILVIDASNGPMPQTREHIILARLAGIKKIIVFLNKTDLVQDADLCDLVEMETRDMLTQYEFSGDSTRVIWGSISRYFKGEIQPIKNLVAELNKLELPERDNKSFLMQISKVFSKNEGIVAMGTIQKGLLKQSDKLFLINKKPLELKCKEIQSFCRPITEAKAGDNIAFYFDGLKLSDIERGQFITTDDSIKLYTEFDADTYILSKDEGGRRTPFKDDYIPQFYFGSFDSPGKVKITAIKGKKSPLMAEPGENVSIRVKLEKPFAISKDMRVTIRDGQRTIGAGKINKVL